MTTIKDVARACGVSTATVSYVLNGKNGMLPGTRERVLRTVRELNYHPSAVARGLSHKRMNTLGILFGTVNPGVVVTHSYASSILQGVLAASSRCGYNVTFYTDPWQTADRSAGLYRDRRTDGIIVVAPPTDSDIIPGLMRYQVPLVVISWDGHGADVCKVDTDNALGTRLAIEHLVSLGHTRIAHLAGPANMQSAIVRRQTYLGLVAHDEEGSEGWMSPAHPDLGPLSLRPLCAPTDYFDGPNDFDVDRAYVQTRKLLTLPKPPTAIFAANDATALGAAMAARDLGISVPIRLSIVGFDDSAEGAAATPPITSVRQPLFEIGEMAANLLVAQLNQEPAEKKSYLIPPQLIVRESTAPPIL